MSETAPVTAAVQALEPAWVRASSPQVQRDYAAGKAFEQQLASELARQVSPEGEGESEEAAEGAGASSATMASSMVPEALAGALTTGGGLGIAEQLTRELAPHTSPASAGGTRA